MATSGESQDRVCACQGFLGEVLSHPRLSELPDSAIRLSFKLGVNQVNIAGLLDVITLNSHCLYVWVCQVLEQHTPFS
ncbi:hypothetical protein BS17DRAFT_784894 [Gyrodon lividus]|nr:hypothetical protein BS17DRAFT_784894 [Gyrodon lividus]